ncbi:hypothetical protein D3C80_2107740 [compost metagenome]
MRLPIVIEGAGVDDDDAGLTGQQIGGEIGRIGAKRQLGLEEGAGLLRAGHPGAQYMTHTDS